MDIYVLTEQGRVLGAGAERGDCEAIADRRGESGWTDWVEAGPGCWQRMKQDGIWADSGDIQAITQAPLAGYTEMAFPLGADTSRLLERDRVAHAGRERHARLVNELALRQLDAFRRIDPTALDRFNNDRSMGSAPPVTLDQMTEVMLDLIKPWPLTNQHD